MILLLLSCFQLRMVLGSSSVLQSPTSQDSSVLESAGPRLEQCPLPRGQEILTLCFSRIKLLRPETYFLIKHPSTKGLTATFFTSTFPGKWIILPCPNLFGQSSLRGSQRQRGSLYPIAVDTFLESYSLYTYLQYFPRVVSVSVWGWKLPSVSSHWFFWKEDSH